MISARAQKTRERLPNAITLARAVTAPVLPFVAHRPGPVLGLLAAGVAGDMVDGMLARRWDVAGEKGARLDSLADLIFGSAVAIAVLRRGTSDDRRAVVAASLPIGAIRLATMCVSARRFGQLLPLHTRANKAAGLAVMAGAISFLAGSSRRALIPGAAISLAAAVEELVFVSTMPARDPDSRGLRSTPLAGTQGSRPIRWGRLRFRPRLINPVPSWRSS